MDAFEPPAGDDGLEPYEGPWLLICSGVLIFVGAIYLLIGLGFGGLYIALPLVVGSDDPDALILMPLGVLMSLIGGGFGVVNFVAAWGLYTRKMWGFITALVLTALYLPSGCMPFGAVLAYGLLGHEPTRKLFMK